MAELLSSKVVIVEEEPRIRAVPALPTAVVGAVGITERGPIDEAVLVTSFEEYVQVFGGFTANSDLALAVMGFFLNGGSFLWVVRTVHHTDITDPATKTSTKATGTLVAGVDNTATIDGKYDGSYGNRLQIEIEDATSGNTDEFNLKVVEDGVIRETFPNLSMDTASASYAESVINDPKTDSNLISFTDLLVGSRPDNQIINLTGGDDGLTSLDDNDFIGSPAGPTGIRCLDTVQNLTLLIVPGRATPAVHNAMIAYCEVVRDLSCFAVLDPPDNEDALGIVTYVETTAALLNFSEFAAIYWPRIRIINPSKSVFGQVEDIVVPPSGHLCGVYARTDGSRPGGVYVPPAGIEAGKLLGCIGFETDEVLDEAKRDLVYPKRINPLTVQPGAPRYIDGSRTLKGDGNFPYVAERRGVIYIEQSLKQGLQFARHKNNTEELRATVRRTIYSFLLTQMNNGAFRSRDPAKAFFVDVSDALNPPSVIFAGKLVARIGLATNKPAEFIILRFSQDTRALEESLAGGGA